MVWGDEVKGALLLATRIPEAYSANDVAVLERISAQIAPSLENFQLLDELEERVRLRTGELSAINQELESFSYSVSHDLRAPLRHISGFVNLLQEDYGSALDAPGRRHLNLIAESAQRMGRLIDDLLTFSRTDRANMHLTPVDLRALVEEVVQELEEEAQRRTLAWEIGDLPTVYADRSLLRLVLVNLLDNAVKYTRPRETAEIRIGHRVDDDSGTTFYVFLPVFRER